MGSYCMECNKVGCDKVVPFKTGWVTVDMNTGKISAEGTKINYGYHATEAKAK